MNMTRRRGSRRPPVRLQDLGPEWDPGLKPIQLPPKAARRRDFWMRVALVGGIIVSIPFAMIPLINAIGAIGLLQKLVR